MRSSTSFSVGIVVAVLLYSWVADARPKRNFYKDDYGLFSGAEDTSYASRKNPIQLLENQLKRLKEVRARSFNDNTSQNDYDEIVCSGKVGPCPNN